MKIFLAILFSIFSYSVFADSMIEEYKTADKEARCHWDAGREVSGAQHAVYGTTDKVLKNVPAEEGRAKMAAGIDPPKDGFYILDLDQYTQEEKDLILAKMSYGYDKMKEIMKNNKDYEPSDWRQVYNFFFGNCMESQEM